MEDRDKQRAQKRTESECKNDVSLPSKKNPPLRKDKDCDVPADIPENDVFTEPPACPPKAPDVLLVPDALVIGNDEYTAECPLIPDKPGDTGDDVTVVADTFTDFFNFGQIPNINGNQLTFLAGLTESQRDQLADPSTPVSTIEGITKLSTTQATFINDTVTTLKANTNSIAQASAETQLVCLFFNTEQSVTCEDAGFPSGAYTNSTVPAGLEENVNNPSTVAADLYSSPSSQVEADEIAENIATSALKCYYGNEEVTVTCLDAGFSEEVPNDESVISSDGRLRVGTVTMDADTIFSAVDVTAANELAESLALGQLSCFYLNEEVFRSCETSTPAKIGTVASPADPQANQSGNPVLIPVGFIQSQVSTAAANSEAEALADALLECYWVNEEQCKECDIVEVTNPDDPDGPPLYVTPEDFGPRCIEAGTVRSYVSQNDADEQAAILADAALICTYCNPTIYPKCTPETWSGSIPVPPEEIDSTWSISATRGVAEGTVCANDATDVVGVATSVGNTPADIADANDCCYGNDAVAVSCPTDEAGNPVDASLSSDDVVIAKDTLIICDSDAAAAGWVGTTKDYATQLATQLANAALVCIWSNEVQYAGCAPAPSPADEEDVFLEGTTVSATTEAGSFISFSSQAEANSIALTVAIAQLNCVYVNYGGENGTAATRCVPPEYSLGKPTIAQGVVQSVVNSFTASFLADQMADAMEMCGRDGEPGNDGAQTNCNGNCYGYYS